MCRERCVMQMEIEFKTDKRKTLVHALSSHAMDFLDQTPSSAFYIYSFVITKDNGKKTFHVFVIKIVASFVLHAFCIRNV